MKSRWCDSIFSKVAAICLIGGVFNLPFTGASTCRLGASRGTTRWLAAQVYCIWQLLKYFNVTNYANQILNYCLINLGLVIFYIKA